MGGECMKISNSTVRKRLLFVLLFGFLVFLIIDVRLGYVQLMLGKDLTSKAEDSWSRNVNFEPLRGEIIDRNGIALATNKSAPTIFVVPRQIDNKEETAVELAKILGATKEKMLKDVSAGVSIVKIHPEGRKISYDKAKELKNLNLKGVYIAEDSKRVYPFGTQLAHVLGFTGIDNQGLNGLELTYDKQLSGEKGYIRFFADAKGKRMPKIADDYKQPTNGLDVKLTIDSKIQTIIDRELEIANATYQPESMVAIAMNPNNGEILGMSSYPTYNPANYKDVDPIVYNRNLPVWSTYEPGSTFKIITLAAALNENEVNLEKDGFYDDGAAEVGGAHLRCWKRAGHGQQTFLEVVQNSCNPGFVELGQRLGKDKLFKYVREFGFGQKTGIDLSGEGVGLLFDEKKIGPVEAATTAFGQGVSVTPIQQVAAVSAAINGGTLYQPYIAKEFIDSETGEVVNKKTPVAKKQVISKEVSEKIRYALESVVAEGSGKNAFIEDYRVGGKTGTAQKVKNGVYMEDSFIVSFMGFAPADDPQIVVYIAIDHPKNTIQFGGVVAAPIAGNIIRDSLQVLGVPKRKNQIDKELTPYTDIPVIKVPNLVGLKRNELLTQLEDLKIDASGDGKVVIEQSPKAGEKVKEGSTIRVYFDDTNDK